MKTYTANEAKTNFGELLLNAQREPVMVTKNGKPASVMLSHEDYMQMAELIASAASSHTQFPETHHETLRRLIAMGREQIENGAFITFNGSLQDAITTYRTRRSDAPS